MKGRIYEFIGYSLYFLWYYLVVLSLPIIPYYSCTPCLSENCATVHSFISLTNVDRFSDCFHCRILHEILSKIYDICLTTF